MAEDRVGWVDYGKGICIILVVMMHSTLNYGEMVHAEGWMHHVVEFARPFRMPDFFLIAGLFLSRSIQGPLLDFIDRKVIHFAYFYVLWVIIQTLFFEAGGLLSDPVSVGGLVLWQMVVPLSSLWFIHQLAVFYVLTRLLRNVPVAAVFAGAALLHLAHYAGAIDTGWSVTNRVANWYVFFYAGYAFAPFIFRLARLVARSWQVALAGLLAWAVWNFEIVSQGWSDLPGVSLLLGFAGAFAIVTVAALLDRFNIGQALRYAGKHSIVIYLTFFIPMKVAQKGLAATGLIPDVGTASLVILCIAVVSPLIFHRVIRRTPLRVLYERPAYLRLGGRKQAKPVAGSLGDARAS